MNFVHEQRETLRGKVKTSGSFNLCNRFLSGNINVKMRKHGKIVI